MARPEHLNANQVGEQLSLFDASEYTLPEPQMDYDPAAWLARPDVSFHASDAPSMPQESGKPSQNFGVGFHHGTVAAAMQRAKVTSTSQIAPDDYHYFSQRPNIHPVRMSGQTALRDALQEERPPGLVPGEKYSDESYQANLRYHEARLRHPLTLTDSQANLDRGTDIVKSGRNAPYTNAAEATGSISFRSPRENLSTWAEDVAADPGASRHHKLLAEQFDLTIPVRENWDRGVMRGPRTSYVANAAGTDAIDMGKPVNARNLPESLSGQVTEQENLFGESEPHGASKLPILTPKLKKKG